MYYIILHAYISLVCKARYSIIVLKVALSPNQSTIQFVYVYMLHAELHITLSEVELLNATAKSYIAQQQ